VFVSLRPPAADCESGLGPGTYGFTPWRLQVNSSWAARYTSVRPTVPSPGCDPDPDAVRECRIQRRRMRARNLDALGGVYLRLSAPRHPRGRCDEAI
jgi:hypothetical protein